MEPINPELAEELAHALVKMRQAQPQADDRKSCSVVKFVAIIFIALLCISLT